MGPGCKSWGAKNLLRTIRAGCRGNPLRAQFGISTSPCLNHCGGGAAVVVGSETRILKVKDTRQAVPALLSWLPASV